MTFERMRTGVFAVLLTVCVSPALWAGEPAAEPPGATMPSPSVSHRCSGRLRMRGLNFAPGTAVIQDTNSAILNEVVKELQLCPNRTVRIAGHTDARGNDAHNQTLSEERARVVQQYLIDHGIAPARLKAVGYGKTRPVARSDTAEAQRLNRRVTIVFER